MAGRSPGGVERDRHALLGIARERLADRLGSAAPKGEGRQNMLNAYLAGALAAGVERPETLAILEAAVAQGALEEAAGGRRAWRYLPAQG